MARVAKSLGDTSGDNRLTAGGTGLRWTAAKRSRINVRIDYAWGRNDSAPYVLAGEAFRGGEAEANAASGRFESK